MTDLAPDLRQRIREMLERDVDISRIKEELGLPDSDLIYEVVYQSPVHNRYYRAAEKFGRSSAARQMPDQYSRVLDAIARLRSRRGPLRILEQGCGNGEFAFRVASQFQDCRVEGIELTEAGVRAGRERYSRPNLLLEAADGYRLTQRGSYDVVYHVNVLEHVPDKEKYLGAGLDLLRGGGMLVASFPTERYWRFWGLPKYIACRVLRRPFRIHGYSDVALDRYLSSRPDAAVVSKQFDGLFPPRRVYYYVPEALLRPVGRFLGQVERELIGDGWHDPLMFVTYEVRKTSERQTTVPGRERPRVAATTAAKVAALWFLASMPMTWEVLAGRKTFFVQD